MLDENLPTFYFKPASDNPLLTTVYLSANGSDLQPEYVLKRPNPALPASKNCYAVALYDSYNPEVLFAEVLVQPEWQQPTLSQAEIRAQNGVPPPPVPIVPTSFIVQLYNPDQQVIVKQIAGTTFSSAHWEFEMPETSFRVPSASALDKEQNDPTISAATPKVTFKWRKDGKLSKDISCFLAGKSTEGRKNKEPDIVCAMFKGGNLTMYQPNMHRVDVEDVKGLEVVMLLGASVIKDIFFNANREMFNISSPQTTRLNRKDSGPRIGGKPSTSPPVMTGAVYSSPPPPSQYPPQQQPQQQQRPQQYQQQPQQQQQQPQTQYQAVPPPPRTNPLTQWQIDAETERLKKVVLAEEKERERLEQREQKKIKKMLEQEEKERVRREAEIAKETERLRKQYGVPSPPRVQFASPPAPMMPPRPQPQAQGQHAYHPHSYAGPPPSNPHSQMPQYQSAPHSRPVPVQRPVSTPGGFGMGGGGGGGGGGGAYNIQSLNSIFNHSGGSGSGPSGYNGGGGGPSQQQRPPRQSSSPYLQAPGAGAASSSGFFGLGGKKDKLQKKRSVFF